MLTFHFLCHEPKGEGRARECNLKARVTLELTGWWLKEDCVMQVTKSTLVLKPS